MDFMDERERETARALLRDLPDDRLVDLLFAARLRNREGGGQYFAESYLLRAERHPAKAERALRQAAGSFRGLRGTWPGRHLTALEALEARRTLHDEAAVVVALRFLLTGDREYRRSRAEGAA